MLVVPDNSITPVLLAEQSIKAAATVQRPSPVTFWSRHTIVEDGPHGGWVAFLRIDHTEDTWPVSPDVMRLFRPQLSPLTQHDGSPPAQERLRRSVTAGS